MADENTLRVMHIASGDLWAGAEVQLFTLAQSLNRRDNIELSVVLLNHGTLERKLLDSNIPVTVLDESRLNGLQILMKLIRIIRKSAPDVVHTHRVKENILGSLAARLNRKPALRTTHGAEEHKPAWHNFPKRAILFLDRACGRFLQRRIIAVSEDLAGKLRRDLPAGKIQIIENGVNLEALIRHTVPEAGTHTFRIGIAGRLVPVKRVDIFIRAAAEFARSHPELKTDFHIFGDGPLRTELETLARELKTGRILHFAGHCDNMPQKLAGLDALLITSDHEGLPMILLEAMAMKIPVIAHAVGGIPRVLNEGDCGILVTEQRSSAYAEAIAHLLKAPEVRAQHISRALERVTTLYSSEQNADAYEAVYRQLARQPEDVQLF